MNSPPLVWAIFWVAFFGCWAVACFVGKRKR
jgi:hypothetical protein